MNWEEEDSLIKFVERKELLDGHSMNCSNEKCPCIIALQLVKISDLFLKWGSLHPDATDMMNEIYENENLNENVKDCLRDAIEACKFNKVDDVHRKLIKTFHSQFSLVGDEEE
jgi:hypothetical protein